MQSKISWIAVLFLLCVTPCAVRAQKPEDSRPRVTVKIGVLEGSRLGQHGISAFLGIPYAAAPIEDLRWKPPVPAKKWEGVRQATEFGAACPQRRASWFPYVGWSEDCLYLNVWTPKLSADGRLPVLVYFHGGSNTQGYSQMTPLGPVLAPYGVIVVSANYRLGPFGFLVHPALTAESEHHSSGNYGLLDQLEALRWVRENIGAFGGDPARVTVMGQSAGAVDICLLMSSPLAVGLFQGAIMESGDCESVYNEDIREPIGYNFISTTGEKSGEVFAKTVGVSNDAAGVRRLRSIPADEILKVWEQNRQIHFDAIVDGWVVPEQPAKLFAEGRQMHVPVLVGSNADEATVFGHGGPKTLGEYKQYLSDDTGKYSSEEFRLYPASSDAEVPTQYLRLQSDSFAYGAYSMARAMAHAGERAYLYNFTYAETGKRAALGAYHGEELKFLSDSFPADWEHSRDDQVLGETLRTYWTQFAKTGNPNAAGVPAWPPYDEKVKHRLELGRKVRTSSVTPQLQALETIMKEVLAGAETVAHKPELEGKSR